MTNAGEVQEFIWALKRADNDTLRRYESYIFNEKKRREKIRQMTTDVIVGDGYGNKSIKKRVQSTFKDY